MKKLRGFTLVELLVVLVLLSLVVLAMASALRTASQTQERVDLRLQRMDDLRVVNGFLRAVLGQVSGQKKDVLASEQASRLFFRGEPTTMDWIGVMPARYGVGGLHHFRLFLSHAGELVLQYLPWIDASTQPDWRNAPANVLVTDVTGIVLRYQDAAGEPPEWTAAWSKPDHLPDRVGITVDTEAGAWPELLIALRVLPGTDPHARGPVFGGSIR